MRPGVMPPGNRSATRSRARHGGYGYQLYFALASTVRSLPNTHTA